MSEYQFVKYAAIWPVIFVIVLIKWALIAFAITTLATVVLGALAVCVCAVPFLIMAFGVYDSFETSSSKIEQQKAKVN